MKKLTMTMVLWFAATLLTSLSVFGQSDKIAAGKVFRFINAGKNTALTAQAPYENVVVSATNPDLMSQCWYAESPSNGRYTLRSLNNGKYLATSAATSSPWTWDSEPGNNSTLTITRQGSNYVIRGARHSSTYGYAHAAASNVIVCWEASNENSQWILQEVEMSAEDLQAALDKVSIFADVEKSVPAWQAALDKVFADKSCTTLRPDYASKSKEQLLADETVKSLPEALRNMVVKVATDNWEETNSTDGNVKWDSKHAKKYRVQLYEPYSDPTLGANLAGIQAWSYINN
ncbi:MAG: RICIN domain-containing protein, partial [Paramuribaculum sp.]|nr:RICIN domain-containing protein [Paramuribaculum sp.]